MQAAVINPNHVREQLNGTRMRPQGHKVEDVSFKSFDDAHEAAQKMTRKAMREKTNTVYNATGTQGNYQILGYNKALVVDLSHINTNVKKSLKY